LVLRLQPFGIRRRFINVITACNGFIIATLLALSGAKSLVGSHGWFGTDAAQAFTAELKPGLLATFDMPQYPGQQFDAKVVTTSNAMEMNSRSMLVELQADSADGELFAGAYCQVRIQLPNNPKLMRVPALLPADRGAQGALLGNDDKAVLKPVQLDRDLRGDSVEVVAGLSPSDRVIDSPPETLQSGDQVQLAETTSSGKQAAAAPAAKAD
jgi:hypothetical protein